MLPHKAGFVTLKVLYGVSGNLSFILIFFFVTYVFKGGGEGGEVMIFAKQSHQMVPCNL